MSFLWDGFVPFLCSKELELSKSHGMVGSGGASSLSLRGLCVVTFAKSSFPSSSQHGCDQNKSSVCQNQRHPHPHRLDRQVSPTTPFLLWIQCLKNFLETKKMSKRQRISPLAQVTWVYLMKGKCLHITADTGAVNLEDSGSGDQRALKVLKLCSCPHPLQIWSNAYKPSYCLQYFTLLMQELWSLLSIFVILSLIIELFLGEV